MVYWKMFWCVHNFLLVFYSGWHPSAKHYAMIWSTLKKGSTVCMRKQLRFYWSCSSVVIRDATRLAPKSIMFQVYCNYVHVDTLVFHLYQYMYMYCTFGKNMEKNLCTNNSADALLMTLHKLIIIFFFFLGLNS